MVNNLEKYKKDLNSLIDTGRELTLAIQYACHPEEFEKKVKPLKKNKYASFLKTLPSFQNSYQNWYSESLVLLKQLLPDRVSDFVKLYEKPKSRKSIAYDNYVIEDYLQNLVVNHGYERVVGPEAAINPFIQQFYILESAKKRFESSLFDIKQLVQADIFDSELEAADELNKKGFIRGAGAICGVVLEKHLDQVCSSHKVKIKKKNPSISSFNDKLKDAGVLEAHTWREIQYLGDLRNLCDHKKKNEPTKEDVQDLIKGVNKIIKTVF